MDVSVIIAAAGCGNRMGSRPNKVLLSLAGKPVLAWSLDIFSGSLAVKEIIIAARSADLAAIKQIAATYPKVKKIIKGGETRSASVARALARVNPAFNYIAVHDAARPLLTANDWQALLKVAEKVPGGAILASPVKDSVKIRDGCYLAGMVDRRDVLLAETPQLFPAGLLRDAYTQNEPLLTEATDEAALVSSLGVKIAFVTTQAANFKLTVAEDLPLAEAVLRQRQPGLTPGTLSSAPKASLPQDWPACPGFEAKGRSENFSGEEIYVPSAQILRYGMGWDIHRLTEGRQLILGGVEIPHYRGLAGHSDADVLTHAIIDALLGAAGLGDIGRHFPDHSLEFKNISSLVLLERTHHLLCEKGWHILNIDTNIIAEKPRLAPYIDAIRTKICQTLFLTTDAVSVKAKTAEGLGDIGRETAIAAIALAVIRG